jgi:L-ascorbate metabolism protein UlaG (beta-lactamase superfamily)
LTAAWLGHATVLINFFGVRIVTDPVLFPRIGIRLPFATIGPKRLTAPALTVPDLPPIDFVLLSHAHFDHFDIRTLRAIVRQNRRSGIAPSVIIPPRTADLLRWIPFAEKTELRWGERKMFKTANGPTTVTAWPVNHWGARMLKDTDRGYNAYLIERRGCRILFGGDTALTDSFRELGATGGVDLAILSIGAYDPWIRAHATPEQSVQMAEEAGATFLMPIHHQTFKLSAEPFREPIERVERALRNHRTRLALREIGETFVLPT